VVAGILIARQVNNWNIDKKVEKYLKNVSFGLDKDLPSLEYQIEFRKGRQ
jgi:hypothetical protein